MDHDVMGYLPVYRSLKGWFAFTDLLVFDALLDAQVASGTQGDLLEIGVMHGKSAFFLSRKIRLSDSLVLCDVFEMPPPNSANAAENTTSYRGVTRAAFDKSVAELAPRPPRVFQVPSVQLGEHVDSGSVRFAHVDGGHLYSEVSADVDLIERLLIPEDGWVAFDDIRTPHAPGVAAAVWPALARGPLVPVLMTSTKLYAAREPKVGTTGLLRERLLNYGLEIEEQEVLHHVMLRVVEPLDTTPYRQPKSWRGRPAATQDPSVFNRRLREARAKLVRFVWRRI